MEKNQKHKHGKKYYMRDKRADQFNHRQGMLSGKTIFFTK